MRNFWNMTVVHVLVFLCVLAMVDIASAQDGATLYKTYCSLCHEGQTADAQAPGRDVMKQMSAEQILQVLETGSMKRQAAERSRVQRRLLAEYVSEKVFHNSGSSIPKSAFCRPTSSSAGVGMTRPIWNGWGNSITNARFQSADAARLTAENVPRLKLKWAFGFPGASSAGTQAVIAG